jgi:hypothetical protein
MNDEDWLNLVQPDEYPVFEQIRVRPNGGVVVIWQRLDDGWRLTRVDSEGRVGQATGTNRSEIVAQARAAMRYEHWRFSLR